MTKDNIRREIILAFKDVSRPEKLFTDPLYRDDFSLEIECHILSKNWYDLTSEDWRNTGISVSVMTRYFLPKAFSYYVPSLLQLALDGEEELTFQALLPANQKHIPRGEWWQSFVGTFNEEQRKVILLVLEYIADTSPEGSAEYFLARDGISLWSA